jgi:hypothetical protein
MKVMETAKIIAASTQLRPCIPLPLKALPPTMPSPKTLTGWSREHEAPAVVQTLILASHAPLIPDVLANAAGSPVPDGVPGPIRSFSAERGRSCDDAGSLDRSLS